MEFYTYCQAWGNNIFYRGFKDGRRVTSKESFSPMLFVKSNKKTKYKGLYGQYLEPMSFTDIREAKEFVKSYKDVEGFEVHGMDNFHYQYIANKYPKEIEYDPSLLSVWSIDIEVSAEDGFPDIETANEAILLIAIQDRTTRKSIVFSSGRDLKKKGDYEYRVYKDEYTLLKEFVMYWQQNCPDIITGWNTDTFDVPYIINRIIRILDEDWAKKLSPFNFIREKEVEIRGRFVQTYEILGVIQLDYIQLYKKYTYSQQESYALGDIAEIELGDSKVENPYESFKDFYTNDWDLFVEYNVKDAQLVNRIDDKMKLIDLVLGIAYMAKCNLSDTFGPVKTWDVFIYNYLKDKGIVIPPNVKKHGGEFEGAYVKEPKPAMYGWVMSFDFASLYPTIIRQWNISPETLVAERADISVSTTVTPIDKNNQWFDYAKEHNYTIAANGTMYRKDIEGFLPDLMRVMLEGRKIAKKDMLKLEQQYQETHDESLQPKIAALNNKQMAFKILANSAYGAISNAGFRYFDLRIAEAVTLTGQASDMHIEKSLNEYMNKALKTEGEDYVIAADTDSVYLNVDPMVSLVSKDQSDTEGIVRKFDSVGKDVFQKVINKSINTIFDLCNCHNKLMDMKREAISSKALWTAKKRYGMVVHNSEGVSYNPPKLKIMGLDIVKSSTPKKIREKLKTVLKMMFETDEKTVQKFIADFREEFLEWKIEDISFPRGCNDIEKWADKNKIYKLSTPIHVRGALLYNKYTDRKKYEPIQNKDKIRFVYLKLPNPIREDVISFPAAGKLPKEMDLDKYIDYTKQFSKVFLSPVEGLLTAAGWTVEEQNTLDDFFS